MKLRTLFLCLFLFGSAALSAQRISNNAIGLRLGDSDGFGAEVSYQKSLTRATRLEFDLGWRDNRNYNAFKLVGLAPVGSKTGWKFQLVLRGRRRYRQCKFQ